MPDSTVIRYKQSSPILQIGELYTERKLSGNNVHSLLGVRPTALRSSATSTYIGFASSDAIQSLYHFLSTRRRRAQEGKHLPAPVKLLKAPYSLLLLIC
jgi:hypothetical protein